MENNTHKEKISVFWFRRDLRLDDKKWGGLFEALNGDFPVLPVFIFDEEIINEPTDLFCSTTGELHYYSDTSGDCLLI